MNYLPAGEQDRARAQLRDELELVRYEHHGNTTLHRLAHVADGTLLKHAIADGKYLVDHEKVRLEMRGDCEAQACAHPVRVSLHGSVDERIDTGKLHDRIET